MKPQLNCIFLHSEKIGYGYMGQSTFAAFDAIGVDAYDGLPGSGDVDIASKKAKVCKDVLFMTIPTHISGWYEGQDAHLFTMWESNELPEAMRDTLHNFKTIFVPSQANLELYGRYHDNVHYVPLGVDGARWHFQERRNDIFFNFLVAGSGERKGTDLVHRAFMELFAGKRMDGPIPRLLMKNPRGENFGGENVEVISGYLSPEDEVSLYASAHCYVQPSRGEGWGMQPLQAMAQGCPTILTAAHGHSAFAQYGIPISAQLEPAKYMTMYGDPGDWWEPDYEELKRRMWDAYRHYGEAATDAKYWSGVIRHTFTWEHTAQKIVDIIQPGRFKLNEIPTQWFTPDSKMFRVVTNRNWRADIGGVTHVFNKGVEYWKSADVKRILFENEVLDTNCLDRGDGLTAQQVSRLDAYTADHSACPTCNQPWPETDEAADG